ncbi:MAG: fumarate hydratase, partial [Fusobacteriaceae bacterium]
SFEKAALMAKEALMREVSDSSPDSINAQLEKDLLQMINKTGIGPLGLGGRTTALAVKVETYPCHIASLPVAINLNCHAARHKEVIL